MTTTPTTTPDLRERLDEIIVRALANQYDFACHPMARMEPNSEDVVTEILDALDARDAAFAELKRAVCDCRWDDPNRPMDAECDFHRKQRETIAGHEAQLAEARAAERERCAKVAEDYEGRGMDPGDGYFSQLGDASMTRREIAAAIRALVGGNDVE